MPFFIIKIFGIRLWDRATFSNGLLLGNAVMSRNLCDQEEHKIVKVRSYQS